MQARIEVALLAVVLRSAARKGLSDGLRSQPPSGSGAPVGETRDHPHD